ncbi:LysE family translocator [Algoriphagus sp.]|uniref:LysE family translocator n=1 Tax=Algoriphagus sp. TaxID=1872435 RepID=UPI00391965F3
MIQALFEGIGMGLVLSLMVGPVFFALITASIEQGFRYAAILALGILVSDLIYVVITFFGVSFLTESPRIETTLGYVGGVILVGFGIRFFGKKDASRPNSGGIPLPTAKKRTAFAKGFGINGINPFVMLFWISIASLVTLKSNWDETAVITYYFGLLLTVFGIDLLKAFIAGKLTHLMTPKFRLIMNRSVGVLVCYFGIKMIWSTFSR